MISKHPNISPYSGTLKAKDCLTNTIRLAIIMVTGLKTYLENKGKKKMTEKELDKASERILAELKNAFGVRIVKATCDHIIAIQESKRVEIIFEWLSNDRCYIKVYASNSVSIIKDYKDLINEFWLAVYD